MKNNFLLLVCLGFVLLSSCKDDDKDPFKNYSTDYTGSKLALTFNGKEMTGKAVSFRSLNQDNASIALKGMIPGEDSLVINMPVVALENDDFSFEGENKNADRTVGVKGEVKAGVLNLNTTFKVTSKVVGNWKMQPVERDEEMNPITSCLHLVIDTDIPTIEFPLYGELPINGDFSLVGVLSMMADMFLPMLVTNINLQEDGNLIASYRTFSDMEGTPVETEEGLVRYNVKDGQIYLLIDIVSLMAKSDDPMAGIGAMLNSGIPLKLTVENGILQVHVDRNMMLPFMDLLTSLKPMIDGLEITPEMEESFEITHEGLKKLVDDVVSLVKGSRTIELGLNLVPNVSDEPTPPVQSFSVGMKKYLEKFRR